MLHYGNKKINLAKNLIVSSDEYLVNDFMWLC